MITVAIFVNGCLLYSRSATRIELSKDTSKPSLYQLGQTTRTLPHIMNEGAVALAKKLLDTIPESRELLPLNTGKFNHDRPEEIK